MWFWLWLAFIFFVLILPLSYGWGYRGWGPPYPSYYRRRRRARAVAVSDPPAETGPVAGVNSGATGWSWAADVLCTVFVVAVVWLALAVLL